MTPVVAEAWHKLTVTAQTDAEARKAAADCARAVNAAGIVALKVSRRFAIVHAGCPQTHRHTSTMVIWWMLPFLIIR
jgi:hypothetical protein